MKKINRYCESGDQVAATLCDLYDKYCNVTVHSVPACGPDGNYSFGVSVDDREKDNAIYIGGKCYALTVAENEATRCDDCAMLDICVTCNAHPCEIFKNETGATGYHFENVRIY